MLKYKHVCLESFGYAIPDNRVTSESLERELATIYERFGLHEGRLELMTGIKERRFWSEGSVPSDGSVQAGRDALEKSGVDAQDIEVLLHTSVSRDFLEPATASVVHEKLNIPGQSMLYDISNACLGFLNGMISLANMIELGQVKRGLIVAGESSRQLVQSTIKQLHLTPSLTKKEFKAAFASLTIGSGAAALVMTHDSVSQTNHHLLGGVVQSATQHNHLCRGSADTGFASDNPITMSTDSESLLDGGCALAKRTWEAFKKVMSWTHEHIDRTFCHQVGITHRDRFYEAIGKDPSQDFSTFDFLGNVGSVSLPITTALGLERHPPQSKENIAMLGIGSGLSCVMLGLHW